MPSQTIILLITIYLLVGCKKESPTEPEKHFIRFEYNGKKYDDNFNINPSNVGAGRTHDGRGFIFINIQDVFHGRIEFEEPNCAFFSPEYSNVQRRAPCNIIFINPIGGIEPIDSSAVYLYQSGSIHFAFSNFETKSGIDFFTGFPYSVTYCTIIGTFDLVLANNKGETITITKGEVELHHVVTG
jgi:hypothetical protein